MRKSVQVTIPVLIAGLGILASSALATPKIAKETGAKPCTVCHSAVGKKDLNKAGECFKEKKDLKACNIPAPAK